MVQLIAQRDVSLTIVNTLSDFGDDDLQVDVLLVKSLQFRVHVVDQGLFAVGYL